MRRVLPVLTIGSLAIALASCTPKHLVASFNDVRETTRENSEDVLKNTPELQRQSLETNLDERGQALRGYDPVAYFSEDKAIPGQAKFSVSWKDSKWLFSSLENREKFVKNPEQYAPANGGYCTFGVVLGKKLDGDPEVWSRLNGYLYIFLNEEVKEKFFQDEVGNLQKVVKNWPRIKDKAPEELD